MNFTQFSHYVNSSKYGILCRLLDGDKHYKEAMITIMVRAMRKNLTWIYTTDNEWIDSFTSSECKDIKTIAKESQTDLFNPQDRILEGQP